MSQAPSSQEGTLVDRVLTSSTPARPGSCAGAPQQAAEAAASGQKLPSRINSLRERGLALWGRLNSGDALTAAESGELERIKKFLQHLKDQPKQDQPAQNSSRDMSHPQQASSSVFSAPPQHAQHPRMSNEALHLRFVHLREKQESHGLTAAESQDFRALYDYLPRVNLIRQQGNSHNRGNHAVPAPSRAASSQHQATIPGSQQLRTKAMAQMSVFQGEIMPTSPNARLVQGIPQHRSGTPNRHLPGHAYQRSTTRTASPAVSLAGQKHGLYDNGAQNRKEVQDRTKRARVHAPLDTNRSVGQVQPALKQTSNPGSGANRLQEQPRITLPLGSVDPKIAQETLGEAIKTMQNGGTLIPVPSGMKAFIVPQHSFIACRLQGSSSVFIGSSDTPDIQQSRNKVASQSFLRGLEASMQHQGKMQAGVPFDNIKVAVFDDRQDKLEPISKPAQSDPTNADSGEIVLNTTIANGQGAVASNEDAQVEGSIGEDAAMMDTPQAQLPCATTGLKRPLSAVREELATAEDSNQAAKKVATATSVGDSIATDNCHQAEQVEPSPLESTALLSSLDQTEPPSPETPPEDEHSIPWVPTREEAKEQAVDELVDRAVDDWNARRSGEEQDEWAAWRERYGWQDTDDEEEDSPSSQLHGVDDDQWDILVVDGEN